MARNGSGVYSIPANTLAVSGDPVSSTKFNSLVNDLEADANVDRPIEAGGTAASTALAARSNLGLEIGVDVMAVDDGLLSIAGLTTAADKMIYTTASDVYAVADLSPFARTILDDANAATVRATIGAGTGSGDLLAANDLSDVDSASTALSNIGGQPIDATTTALAGLTTAANEGIYATGADTFSMFTLTSAGRALLDDASASAQRNTLGVGTADDVTFGTTRAQIPVDGATTGNITSGNRNAMVQCTGDMNMHTGIASARDWMVFDSGASARTFTKTSGITMKLNGSNVTSAVLAAQDIGAVHWRSTTICILKGPFT